MLVFRGVIFLNISFFLGSFSSGKYPLQTSQVDEYIARLRNSARKPRKYRATGSLPFTESPRKIHAILLKIMNIPTSVFLKNIHVAIIEANWLLIKVFYLKFKRRFNVVEFAWQLQVVRRRTAPPGSGRGTHFTASTPWYLLDWGSTETWDVKNGGGLKWFSRQLFLV